MFPIIYFWKTFMCRMRWIQGRLFCSRWILANFWSLRTLVFLHCSWNWHRINLHLFLGIWCRHASLLPEYLFRCLQESNLHHLNLDALWEPRIILADWILHLSALVDLSGLIHILKIFLCPINSWNPSFVNQRSHECRILSF